MRPSRIVSFLKQFKVLFTPSALIAVMVAVFSAAAVVLPAMASNLFESETQYQLSQVSEMNQSLNGATTFTADCLPWATWEERDCWEVFREELAAETAGIEDPLQGLLGYGRIHFKGKSEYLDWPEREKYGAPIPILDFGVYPELSDEINLLEGRLPESHGKEIFNWIANEGPIWYETATHVPIDLEIVLSKTSAEQLQGWKVGETRNVSSALARPSLVFTDYGLYLPVTLVGIYEPLNSENDFWQRFPYAEKGVLFDDGNAAATFTGTGYLHPEDFGIWQLFTVSVTQPFTQKDQINYAVVESIANIWYPIDVAKILPEDTADLAAQLRRETGALHDFSFFTKGVSFSSGVDVALSSASARGVLMDTTYALVIVGPLGVAIVVLILTSQIALQRLSASHQIQRARGASGPFLRSRLFMLSLVISIPAAVIGVLVGAALKGSVPGVSECIIAGVAALVPAVIAASTLRIKTLYRNRTDLGVGKVPLGRRILEITVLILAVVGIVLLLIRGKAKNVEFAVDPLVLVAPLLVALAGSILVLRLYPYPLSLLENRFSRGKKAVNWLGVIRNRRDAAVGTVPVFALVLGATVAVFASVFSASISDGVQRSITAEVGSDIRINGHSFDEDTIAKLNEVPGISSVAPLIDLGTQNVRDGESGRETAVSMYVTDAKMLAQVQKNVYGGISAEIGEKLSADSETPTALFSSSFAGSTGFSIRGKTVDVIGFYPNLPGTGKVNSWILMDTEMAKKIFNANFITRILLINIEDGADPETVVADISSVIPQFSYSTKQDASDRILESPIVNAFGLILWIVILVTIALLALTVMLILILQRPERARSFVLLSTLGASAKQRRRLLLWEVAPVTIFSGLAALLLGFALAVLMLFLVDFSPFTGGTSPEIVFDLFSLLIPVGIVLASAVLVWVTSPLLARIDVLGQLRLGAES